MMSNRNALLEGPFRQDDRRSASRAQPTRPEPVVAANPPVVAPVSGSHEEIARRAYEIYLQDGCQNGQCQRNWDQAEAETRRDEQLMQKTTVDMGTEGGAPESPGNGKAPA